METCVDLDAATRAYIIDQARSIFPPKDDDEARLVAAAGDPAVTLLGYNPALSPSESVACVRALAQIGSTAAMNAISKYMAHSDDQVVEAVIDAWELFDRAEYARQVLSQSTSLVIPRLTSWEGFEYLRQINTLAIADLAPDIDLQPLRQCVTLTKLSLGADVPENSFRILLGDRARLSQQLHQPGQTQISKAKESLAFIDLTPVADLYALKHVSLSHPRISDLSPLAALTNLTRLYVSGTTISNLSPLVALTNLTRLYVSGIAVSDLSPLIALTNLTTLIVSGTAVNDLAPLAVLTNLTTLIVSGPAVSDLSPLVALTNLTTLIVSGTAVNDLAPLAALTNLTQLYVIDTTVSDLAPLVALTNLTRLYMIDTMVSDLSPLVALTNLTELTVRGNALLDSSQITRITTRMPHLKVMEFDRRLGKIHIATR